MSQTKKLNSKNKKVTNEDTGSEIDIEESIEPKSKKPVDLEAALEPAVLDEKIAEEEEVSILGNDDMEDGSDELSLDEEEINPFGDKWEQ